MNLDIAAGSMRLARQIAFRLRRSRSMASRIRSLKVGLLMTSDSTLAVDDCQQAVVANRSTVKVGRSPSRSNSSAITSRTMFSLPAVVRIES